jgi:hypothetical protein
MDRTVYRPCSIASLLTGVVQLLVLPPQRQPLQSMAELCFSEPFLCAISLSGQSAIWNV